MSLMIPSFRMKRATEIAAEEMAWLATAEDVLRTLKATIICTQCRTPFHGSNDATDATMEVSCECRRLTYRVRADAPASH
jgi:hypothetical protein